MVYAEYEFDDAQVLIWEITESEQELLKLLKNKSEKSAFELLKSEKRKKEFLAVRVALEKLLGRESSIVYTEAGKPYLSDKSFKISISHSKEWVALMIHPSLEVGIDIEVSNEKVWRVYKKYLNKEEINRFISADNKKTHLYLQLIWCAKEALYKIIGRDSADFASSMSVLAFDLEKEGLFDIQYKKRNKTFKLKYYQNKHFSLALCLNK